MYANDIVLLVATPDEEQEFVKRGETAAGDSGKSINVEKTKVMTNTEEVRKMAVGIVKP